MTRCEIIENFLRTVPPGITEDQIYLWKVGMLEVETMLSDKCMALLIEELGEWL